MIKLLANLLFLITHIKSESSTILIPNPKHTNSRSNIILQPKPKKQITPTFHHRSHAINQHGKHESRDDEKNKRIHLPTRMIENLPKEKQIEYQELQETRNNNMNDNDNKSDTMEDKDNSLQQEQENNSPQLVNIPDNSNNDSSNMKVLFYDPMTLENNIPSSIFDENGDLVDLSGQQVLLLSPDTEQTEIDAIVSHSNTKNMFFQPSKIVQQPQPSNSKQSVQKNLTNLRKNHPKDNMILFGTILIMAVFVGALTGKRIRKSCNFLKYFIESEGDDVDYGDQEDRESILMGRDYDTFGRYAGECRWRGDLEKFDV